jgi:hypothetical protein
MQELIEKYAACMACGSRRILVRRAWRSFCETWTWLNNYLLFVIAQGQASSLAIFILQLDVGRMKDVTAV